MQLFVKSREKFGYWILNRKNSKIKRNRFFKTFSSAKNVGILFDASSQEAFNRANKIIKNLIDKKLNVSALGFVNTKEALKWYSPNNSISVFSLKNLNWFFKPKEQTVTEFCAKPFDILIDITLQSKLPLAFIVRDSKSGFKISSQFQKDYSDFVIDIKDNVNLEYFIEQVNHYLTSISEG